LAIATNQRNQTGMHDNELIFGGDFFDLEEELAPTTDKLQLREGELREVTMLFADIKGFSSISNLFDAETIHRKMDEIMKIFSRCIGFYGGFVDKYMGDGIMALFGAKLTTEQDTERALLAALKMQQQLRLYNALLNRQPGFEKVELGVRVGINAGLVSVGKVGEDREGDFTVYGPEVNLASRMESNAPVNRIMLPEKTMFAAKRNFEFEAAGLKSVKGFDEPIPCYLLVGPKLDSSLHRRNHSTRYIGREEELRLLQSTFDQLGRSEAIPLLGIRGEAGLGKTRLAYEFELANQNRARFLHGACSAVSPTPLNLFTSVCETLFRTTVNDKPELKRSKLETGFKELLAQAEPGDSDKLRDIHPLIAFLLELKSDDPRLKQSGTDLLGHLSQAVEILVQALIERSKREHKPLVMVLDDLHWLDEASAKVLENLLNRLARTEVKPLLMFVLMFRLEYELPEYFGRLAKTCEVELKPLSENEIKTLITNHAQSLQLSNATLEKVVSLSQGNPFFLEEWCNYIGDLPKADLQDFPVPANLHMLIQSRLDKLPQDLRMLLHKASVIGQEFFVDILRFMESKLQDPIDIDATLSTLEDQALILKMLGFEYSTYFFKHITTREVAYKTLLSENRKLLHKLCGEAIEALYADRLEDFTYALAEHFSRAGIEDKAALYLQKAAGHAAEIYNNQQALQLYSKLLELPSLPLTQALETRMRMADIKWLTGDWKAALAEGEKLLPEAEEAGLDKLCFEIHRFLGIAAFYKADMQGSKSRLDEAEKLAQKLDDPFLLAIAAGNLGNWFFQQNNLTEAKAKHQQCYNLAVHNGDLQRQAKTLSNLGLIYLEEKDFELAETYFRQSLEIAAEHRMRKEESIALGNLGWTKMLTGDMEAALPLLEQKLKLAEEMNDKLELIKVLGNIGNLMLSQEDKTQAKFCYSRILELRNYLGDENGAVKVREFMKATFAADD